MKYTIVSTLLLLGLAGCTLGQTQTSPSPNEDSRVPLSFAGNTEVGVSNKNSVETVYILNTINNNKIYLDKPAALTNRPVANLKKVGTDTFSFMISTTPHFGQSFVYNLEGKTIAAYPVGDECYFADSLPKLLADKATEKCQTNPEFGTLDEVTERLKNQ